MYYQTNNSALLEKHQVQFSNLYWSSNTRNLFISDVDGENQYWEHMTVVPILATIMLAITVFLLILFKQSPTLVAGTVAGTLTIVGVYLVINSMHENRAKYE